MASKSDIRDIMNLGQAGPRQPAPKKKRLVEPQHRVTGVKREVQALMGDSVPPIAIVEQRSYKSRPSISQKLFKPRHWEERPFQHGGRADGLVLRHWKRSIPGLNPRPPPVANSAGSTDVDMTDEHKTSPPLQEVRFEDEFPSHKWNVKVQVPSYTDEQYENSLQSEEWTREETDYLMDLCREYDLRWVTIADRYTPQDIPPPQATLTNGGIDSSALVAKPHYLNRSMEALKQRYYAIAAKILEAQTPASNMTQTEFQLWEKMRNFDAKTETMRKAMAEKLFERTKDEADEERILLEELQRITKNEDDFIKMRRDLYARLEPVAPIRRTERGEEQSTAMYQTSGGLSMLLQTLLAKEKRLKRPTVPGSAEPGPASATPTDVAKYEKGRHPNQYSRRDTMDTQADEVGHHPPKKGSTSQPSVRVLTPQDEARFGVSHLQERVTSGVQFRHEKINRLTMAKSQAQTTKIQAALTELGIPPRLLMPTERVCREFERLTTEINVLLDCRKVNEKIASEIKILEEVRRIRLGLPKDGEQQTSTGRLPATASTADDAMDVDSSRFAEDSKVESTQNDSMAVPEEDQDAEGEDDDPTEKTMATEIEDANDESSMQVDKQADEDDEEVKEDGDVSQAQAIKTAEGEDEEDDEEEDEDQKPEAEENEEEEQNDEDTGGLDNEDEDEDQDGDDDNEDDEENDAEEDEEAEVAATPDNDSDAEEGNEDYYEEEVEPEVESSAEEEAGVNDDEEGDDVEVAPEPEDSDTDSDAKDGVDEGEDEEEDHGEAEAEAQAEGEDDEDQGAGRTLAPLAAARTHKRSASVISEASRAGSNRSAVGRKKRR